MPIPIPFRGVYWRLGEWIPENENDSFCIVALKVFLMMIPWWIFLILPPYLIILTSITLMGIPYAQYNTSGDPYGFFFIIAWLGFWFYWTTRDEPEIFAKNDGVTRERIREPTIGETGIWHQR